MIIVINYEDRKKQVFYEDIMKRVKTQVRKMLNTYSQIEETSSFKDIIVFSHLRWEFVKQRPQHLLERLAKGRKLLFVEEPIAYAADDYGTAHEIKIRSNITVIQPRIDHEDWSTLHQIVEHFSNRLQLETTVLWFYSPAFVDMTSYINTDVIVYDCMDQLTAFKGAPAKLIDQEKQLLNIANVVFTGGKSLYEEKRKYHPNVVCFPSSVDRKHFEKALSDQTPLPPDINRIHKPIVGFYGVIDERIDLQLLSAVAKKLPEVSFVMIGPVVKIQESDLPRAFNLHYLGGRSYDVLPEYLKAFQIAMMPFALNESTQFISPTKTLEFMAAQKPIVSTPIFDVKRDYAREVKIASTAAEFAEAITFYLYENSLQKSLREAMQRAVIDRTSWDKTALMMYKIINQIAQKPFGWQPQHEKDFDQQVSVQVAV